MIAAKTQYKTYDTELLAIVEAFKTWKHYQKDYKHKILIFTHHNNFTRFMDINNLGFKQVHWA